MTAKLSKSVEDYLKAIYVLQARHPRAGTRQISQELGVRQASVTGMLKHLAGQGYIEHEPYKGAALTPVGRQAAVNLLRRHRLIELFLARTLGVSWDELHQDAEILEHTVSDRLIERIDRFLGHPEFDPHGQPIPRTNGEIPDHRGVCLDQLDEGDRGEVVEVTDSDPNFLRYLTDLDLRLGTHIEIEQKAPYGGSIELRIGPARAALGTEAAARIWVAVASDDPRQPINTPADDFILTQD